MPNESCDTPVTLYGPEPIGLTLYWLNGNCSGATELQICFGNIPRVMLSRNGPYGCFKINCISLSLTTRTVTPSQFACLGLFIVGSSAFKIVNSMSLAVTGVPS